MLKPGMIVGDRYEIIDKVGSGGMADVYKARDQRLNRFVAIKVLKPEYSGDKSFVNKFRGEAQSSAGLSHPNIVNVFDVGDDGNLHYIVMELVEGITLKRFIERKGKLDVKEAVGIGIQIAQGMEAAHDNHIIHRDIKPQNIIISRDGKVKVTDFGIAKATTSNTITSNAMGSVHYLSPEQARGGYSDEKSDIYSLGVTLYEMLSGKVPFAGDNTVSVALLHIQGEAMPLRELDPQIPASLDKIVQKCMQKRPERRYHTASELIADLKKAISDPDGDFVEIPAYTAPDSPTINITSEELSRIKSGAYIDDDTRPTRNLQTMNKKEEDDEELDTVDSKVEKVFMIGMIIAAVVLVVVIFVIVGWFMSTKGSSKNNPNAQVTVTPTIAPTPYTDPDGDNYNVPKVLGLGKDDAENLLKSYDDKVVIVYSDEEYSNDYAAGEIMKQYPDPDSPYAKGSTVILTLSKGAQDITVPNIGGLTEDKAKQKLEEYGLVMSTKTQNDDTVKKGLVISADPAIGAQVNAGDTITVYISSGPADTTVEVPNLIDKTKKQAIAALSAAGLELGDTSYEASKDYKEGHVTYQSYSSGVKVNEGTKVDITLSTGPDDTTYGGVAYIDKNPFDYLNIDKSETIEVVLTYHQGKQSEDFFAGTCSYDDFPLNESITGLTSSSDCYVTMTVNGDSFVIPGDSAAYRWDVDLSSEE